MDVEDAKTPTGIREVDLTPRLVHEMTAHRAWMERAGHDVSSNAHVFQSTAGTPLRPEASDDSSAPSPPAPTSDAKSPG
jgi:hypothetical protein